MAIEQGLTILNWFENLPKDEVPPEYLWEDSEGLEWWWSAVEEKRESGDDAVSRPGGDEDDQSSSMADNELARFLKQG